MDLYEDVISNVNYCLGWILQNELRTFNSRQIPLLSSRDPCLSYCFRGQRVNDYFIVSYDGLPTSKLGDLILSRHAAKSFWREHDLLSICKYLFRAMETLHSNEIYHAAIFPGNLYIVDEKIYIGVLGSIDQTLGGTYDPDLAVCIPPEALSRVGHSEIDWMKVDVWMMGMCILQMAVLKPLNESLETLLSPHTDQAALDSFHNDELSGYSEDFRNLLIQMHQLEPRGRPSFEYLFRQVRDLCRKHK